MLYLHLSVTSIELCVANENRKKNPRRGSFCIYSKRLSGILASESQAPWRAAALIKIFVLELAPAFHSVCDFLTCLKE